MDDLSYFPTTVQVSFCGYHTELQPKSAQSKNI